ncbi:hypothetical protein [Nocardioides alcanivorans]|uniref:hypothetical protein n=1 Tax=Nocardioides alcanivorans TaxID=2897352 RepID=UPI001F328A3F|nr:hypothetical protein [Nocardioides alcanivorans]
MAENQESQPEPEWKRRRRLAAIFGDVLPDSTSDDRDPEDARSAPDGEEWLKQQVPPHHGGN